MPTTPGQVITCFVRLYLPKTMINRRFYEALGFSTEYVDESIAIMSNGTDSFILQNFFVEELAENFMLQLSVADAHNWRAEHDPVQLAEKFGTKPPISSSVQP